jgi:hypothetical protein
MTFAARISRVRMKNGGADLHILQTPRPHSFEGRDESIRGKIIEHARWIADVEGPPLDGFIVIGLFADGKRSCGFRIPERIPRELLPSYVADIVRRDAIVQFEAESVFDQKFEWIDE